MPGIIHFDRMSRRQRPVSRRSMMLGAAGLAGASAVRALASSAQEPATPQATPGEVKTDMGLLKGAARERLKGLLALVPPDLLGGPDPDTMLFSWTDLQTQLSALGNPDLFVEQSPAFAVTSTLYMVDPLVRFAMTPEVKETFGFSPLEIHQVLVAGEVPDQVTFYAGGAPVDELPSIWEKAGYKHKQAETGEYWTVGENAEMNLGSPVGQMGVGLLNNVAIVNDDILVFAPKIELLQAVQKLAVDGGESAADNEDVGTLLGTMPETAASMVALPGAALNVETIVPDTSGPAARRQLMDLLAESDDAASVMPVGEMAFFGVTAGGVTEAPDDEAPIGVHGNPDAFIFIDMLMGSPEEAATAEDVVDWRVQNMTSPTTGRAYSDVLAPDSSARPESAGPVATFAFTSPITLAVWSKMVNTRDLWPFVYLPEE